MRRKYCRVAAVSNERCETLIPASIVRLNRATIVLGVLLALLLRVPPVPPVTTLPFAVALAGFCFGCFLFYQFKLNRARIFGDFARAQSDRP